MDAADRVTEFIRAIERRDIAAAIEMTAADISYENMPIDPIEGHDAVRATLEMFLAPATSVDWQITRQHQVGDGVVVNERLDRFQIGDGWLELPIAGFFELDDAGLITLWRDYFDMGSYQRQLAELT